MTNKTYNIFKAGSRTYFYSSLFFPKEVREDVFTLYAFVRVADDFVDSIPQKGEEFLLFNLQFLKAWRGEKVDDEVVGGFVEMAKRTGIEKEWVDAFLGAMESDLNKTNRSYRTYKTYPELEKYIYGSAEVIGFMMARIMKLPNEALETAGLLGKAMQYVNFIRDVDEDEKLGRKYLPGDDVKAEIVRYRQINAEAKKGFKYIPKRYLIPIKTATKMYEWTADQIEKNPQIIFEKKVKPSVFRIIWTGIISSCW